MTNNTNEIVLALGKAQIDAMFRQQWVGTMVDDSEFLPLVEVVLNAFETAGIDREVGDELWEYTFDLYDKTCKQVEPDSASKENRQMMQRYLSSQHPGSP